MSRDSATLFLCGDVMTGRGIDQILLHPGDPRLCEDYVRSALGYVEIAEERYGLIPRPAGFDYIWGDALEDLGRTQPDARIINLETAVTRRGECVPKGINYRMNPANLPCLTAAAIDCCVLANNHVLDWGEVGLLDTLDSLSAAGLKTAGAGRDAVSAAAPAIIERPEGGRILVFAYGCESSGIPFAWAAAEDESGVNFISELSGEAIEGIGQQVRQIKQPGDIAVLSIHWSRNWGYAVSEEQRRFAHGLIDRAAIDMVHGHSSHHAKGIEVYREKLVLYGCGDFINDYEGISGHEEFRPDLAIMYLPNVSPADGSLRQLTMVPYRVRNFRLVRASTRDAEWLQHILTREGKRFGTRARIQDDAKLALDWR